MIAPLAGLEIVLLLTLTDTDTFIILNDINKMLLFSWKCLLDCTITPRLKLVRIMLGT